MMHAVRYQCRAAIAFGVATLGIAISNPWSEPNSDWKSMTSSNNNHVLYRHTAPSGSSLNTAFTSSFLSLLSVSDITGLADITLLKDADIFGRSNLLPA